MRAPGRHRPLLQLASAGAGAAQAGRAGRRPGRAHRRAQARPGAGRALGARGRAARGRWPERGGAAFAQPPGRAAQPATAGRTVRQPAARAGGLAPDRTADGRGRSPCAGRTARPQRVLRSRVLALCGRACLLHRRDAGKAGPAQHRAGVAGALPEVEPGVRGARAARHRHGRGAQPSRHGPAPRLGLDARTATAAGVQLPQRALRTAGTPRPAHGPGGLAVGRLPGRRWARTRGDTASAAGCCWHC